MFLEQREERMERQVRRAGEERKCSVAGAELVVLIEGKLSQVSSQVTLAPLLCP